MRKRTLLLSSLTSVLILSGLGVCLYFLLNYEPGFYRRGEIAPGPARKAQSNLFLSQFTKLLNCVIDGEPKWEVTFTEQQLNSYFAEDFIRLGDSEAIRRHGISEPRVALEHDRLRLGFCYGSGPWRAVVSVDLRVWLAANDINVVLVEILGRQVGALPISSQSLLQHISEVASKQNIEIAWYRHEGNPVAMLRFQGDRPRPTTKLRHLEVRAGNFTINGQSFDQAPQAVMETSALNPQGN